ncbi:MAG: hypothetical protein WCD89_16085 [Anaerocolumna sp.]
MKGILHAIRKSKYYKLISGFIFACLALPFFIWGIYIILLGKGTYREIIIPLIGILTCLLFGLHSMFHKEKIAEATF